MPQSAKPHRKPRLPPGICIYAVSDIHGCAEQLGKVFEAIDHHMERVRPHRPIHVFLGDYIDRGPASRQVIDMLIDRGRRYETAFLRGNHEEMLLELLRDPGILRDPSFLQRSSSMAACKPCSPTAWPPRSTPTRTSNRR